MPSRRTFLLSAASLALAGRGTTADPLPADLSLADIGDRFRAGKLTSRQLTEHYLRRIEEIDRRGPTLNSVIELNPDALALADACDRAKKPRGPLHGVPVLIKDNLATADKMETTAGSLALVGVRPPKDAFVVRKLRDAGAVILGKTNLSEWANFRASESMSGWSGRGGQTRNAHVLDRNPSGSSSGTGAAVAAELCAVGIGTETDGSIVSPSSVNGIVGLKPTVGLVGRTGIIPISASQDTAGPMGRTVRDVAILLGVIAGTDPDDPATAEAKVEADYTKFLDANGLKGARLGVWRKMSGFKRKSLAVYEDCLRQLKAAGATLVDDIDPPGFGESGDPEMTVLLYEFKQGVNDYLTWLGPKSPVKSLADVIAFNERNKDRELVHFGQDLLIQANELGPLTEKRYTDALAACRRRFRKDGIDAAMDKDKLDAIVAPTDGPAWLIDPVNLDAFAGSSSTPPAVAGYPSITVPAGFVRDLPVGLTFFGRAWTEPTLLKLAYAFEQATQARRAPKFRPSVGKE